MRARLEFMAVAGTALLFVVLAPLFWYSVESPDATVPPPVAGQSTVFDEILPLAQFNAAQLREGVAPLWSPDILLGVPFHALPSAAVFSPARVLDLSLDPPTALAALAFVHLLLAALSMLLLLRSMEVSWAGVLPGAAAYAFSGTMAGAMSLPGVGAAYAIGPLLLWGAYVAITRGERGGVWVAGVALGVVMLCGSVDKPLALWLLAAAWGGALCPFLRGRPRWRRWALWCVGTLVIGIGIAAIQLVPALHWASGLLRPWELFASVRVPGEAPGGPSGLLLHLLQPADSPVPPLGFVGAVGVLLVLPALAGRKRRTEAFSFAAFCAALLAGAALDVGRDLPGLNAELLLFLLPLPAAALVGIGGARVLAVGKDPRAREVWLPALTFIGAWVALMALGGAQPRGWLIAAALLLVLPMLLRWRWLCTVAGAGLALLLFAELANTSTDYYGHPFLGARVGAAQHEEVLQRAGALALDGRVLLLSDDAPQLAAAAAQTGVRTLDGARQAVPRALEGWWQAADASLLQPPSIAEINNNPALLACLRALDVRAAIVKTGNAAETIGASGGFRAADAVAPYTLFALDTPGRAHWVPQWEIAADYATALKKLTDPGFNPALSCVLESAGWFGPEPPQPAASATPPAASGATWRVEAYAPGMLDVVLNAPTPGVLVAAGQMTAGWQAAVDGESAPVYRANRLTRGVVLPAGEHRVTFRYRPWPLYLGACISTFTLLAALFGILVEGLRRHSDL